MKSLVLVRTALVGFAAVSFQAVPMTTPVFENPPFTLGPIHGRGGWFVFSASNHASDPAIENALVRSGRQAVGVAGCVSGQTGPVYARNLTLAVLDMSAAI
jgi:hypothetical protein